MDGNRTLAVILTAVEVETASIMSSFDGWKRKKLPGDEQRYFEAFLERDGQSYPIITAQQAVMGMTASSSLAMKAIYTFHPEYLIMSGIAAGTGEESLQMYGDVLVPDMIWDYSTGKYVGPDEAEIRFGDVGFLPRPVSIATDPELLTIIRDTIGAEDNEFHVHVGPLACGSSVVANSNMVDKQIKALFPHTIGLDMESYSVYYAAANACEPKPKAIVVKSICDFANSEKGDKFQRFAAYTSAGYVNYLLRKHLPVDQASELGSS